MNLSTSEQEDESVQQDDQDDSTESQSAEGSDASAEEGGGADDGQADDDEANPFPEGSKQAKAFIREREKRKQAEEALQAERDRNNRVEEKLDMILSPKKKADDEDDSVVPTEAEKKIVAKALKEMGLDPQEIRTQNQRTQLTLQLNAASDKLKDEADKLYEGSVPYNRDEVIEYAVKNGFALAQPNAPIEHILRQAFKQMNEDKIVEFKAGKRTKKSTPPTKIENGKTGTSPSPKQDERRSPMDFRRSALARSQN